MDQTPRFIFIVVVFAPNSEELDRARRQADLMGRPGMEAKRGQTNYVFYRDNSIRLRFKSRATAKDYQARVLNSCGPKVTTQRLRQQVPVYRPRRVVRSSSWQSPTNW